MASETHQKELQQIFKEDYKIELSPEKSEEVFNSLVQYFEVLLETESANNKQKKEIL